MKTSVKFIALLTFGILFNSGAFAQTNWTLDRSHSNVKFTVTHLVISEVDGVFRKFDGNMTASKEDFTDAKINFTVDVNSIDTENDNRDAHLKGDDFFNAEKYSQMTFVSTAFKKVSGNKYELTGDLTIRDVKKSVKFDVIYGGTTKDPWGNIKAGFKATTSIDRLAYGLKWNTLTEAGGAVVGKDVKITINVEFTKAQ